jgi:hypothetical protein
MLLQHLDLLSTSKDHRHQLWNNRRRLRHVTRIRCCPCGPGLDVPTKRCRSLATLGMPRMFIATSRSGAPAYRSTSTAPVGRERGFPEGGGGARCAFCACVCMLVLVISLSGCALYGTYEKCGLRGCPADAKITAGVVSLLSENSSLEPNVINVQTLDHVVYLYGVVSSGLEIGTAESIALQAPGVARVVNSIVISNAR